MIEDYHKRKQLRKNEFLRWYGVKDKICVACDGSGRYDHNGSSKCGSCNGTGKIKEPNKIS